MIALALSLSLVPSLASASKIRLDAVELSNLPRVKVLKIEVKGGGGMLTVQPTGEVTFEFASCRHIELVPSVTEVSSVQFVKLQYPKDAFDCMGPSITRAYTVQFTSDIERRNVVILNPLVQE